jgi:hypothetical protein
MMISGGKRFYPADPAGSLFLLWRIRRNLQDYGTDFEMAGRGGKNSLFPAFAVLFLGECPAFFPAPPEG